MLAGDRDGAATESGSPPGIVLAVAVVVALSLAAAPPATFALSRDTDWSAANPLQSGSFDGKLTELGPATENSTTDESAADRLRDTWEDYSHTNGSTGPVNNTVDVENPNASFAVRAVNVTASYAENDSARLDNDNAQTTAKTLNVSTFRYDGTSYKADITDANGNGRADLDDLARTTTTLDGIAANESAALTLAIAGDSRQSDNIGGGDGIDFTMSVTATVRPSWNDTDRSVNNTIQYESS